jgi:hypothetical protein
MVLVLLAAAASSGSPAAEGATRRTGRSVPVRSVPKTRKALPPSRIPSRNAPVGPVAKGSGSSAAAAPGRDAPQFQVSSGRRITGLQTLPGSGRYSLGNIRPDDRTAAPAIQGTEQSQERTTEAAIRRANEKRSAANLRVEDPSAVPAVYGSDELILPPAGSDPGAAEPTVAPPGVRDPEAFRRRSAGNYLPGDPTAAPAVQGTRQAVLDNETHAAIRQAEERRTRANLRLENPAAAPAVQGTDRMVTLPNPGNPQAPKQPSASAPPPVPRDERPDRWKFNGRYRVWIDPPTGHYYRFDPNSQHYVPLFGIRRR